jgi:enamine deaminase RidA (YjgF/YER057c/UK114 family)
MFIKVRFSGDVTGVVAAHLRLANFDRLHLHSSTITCSLFPTMSSSTQPQTFNPKDVPLPPPSYHQVAITPLHPTSRLITLAGMTGCDPSSSSNPSTVPTQAPIAYANILKSLAAAGATPRDIVQVKHYIVTKTGDAEVDKTDVVDRGWAELWCKFMDKEADGHRPPDTVIGVASLAKKDILYECEVWAVVTG